MVKDIYILLLIFFFILSSCKDKNTLPKNIDKRIFGEWVISPSLYNKAFIMYKYDSLKHDKCYKLRFNLPKELYWHYLDKSDSENYFSCGNTLRPNYKSTWSFKKSTIVIDKIWTSTQEFKRQKLSYFIYEFSPDTFTFILKDTLLTEHKMGFYGNSLLNNL